MLGRGLRKSRAQSTAPHVQPTDAAFCTLGHKGETSKLSLSSIHILSYGGDVPHSMFPRSHCRNCPFIVTWSLDPDGASGEDAALQVSSYMECLGPLVQPGAHDLLAYRRCAVINELYCQVKELQGTPPDCAERMRKRSTASSPTPSKTQTFNHSGGAGRACCP